MDDCAKSASVIPSIIRRKIADPVSASVIRCEENGRITALETTENERKNVAFGRYAPKNESVCFFAARQKRIDVLGSPDLPTSDASCKMSSEAFKNIFIQRRLFARSATKCD